ncbi:MAG TPA: hypothetical protein VK327_05520 [Candidatus Paceibacterota bacterium]|nr:hypothetical protein [Candidatus Paceibacterota bacterium]
MKSDASQLHAHLEAVLLADESTDNLVSLARLIWLTLSPLPAELQSLRLDRKTIAQSFVQWCSAHRIPDSKTASLEFWDAQIIAALKTGTDFDAEAALRLYRERTRRDQTRR